MSGARAERSPPLPASLRRLVTLWLAAMLAADVALAGAGGAPAEIPTPESGSDAGAARIRASRYFEPVEIIGIGPSEGVWRFEDGSWRAVPFQRDRAIEDHATVLAEDVGGPSTAVESKGLRELRVRDPLDGAEARLYLGALAGSPEGVVAPSPAPAIQYQAEPRTIQARCYALTFDGTDPALFTSLSVSRDCGGSGENMLARLDSHSTATLVAIGSTVETGRADLVSEVLDLSGGPIFLSRDLGYRVRLPFGRLSGETKQEARFHPYHYVFPVKLEIPALVDYVVSSLDIEFSSRWRASVAPMRFVTGAGASAIVDGHMAEGESALDGAAFSGWRLDGVAGRVVNLLSLDPDSPFEARLRYRDDQVDVDGEVALGLVGFVLRSKGSVSGRPWTATSTTIFPRPGDDRSPADFARLLATPLRVEPLSTESK